MILLVPNKIFFLLGVKIDVGLYWTGLHNLDELYAAVNGVVRAVNVRCFATGIRVLPKRWKSTMRSAGNYIEIM